MSPSIGAPNGANVLQRAYEQAENPFAKLIAEQQFVVIPRFELESGAVLRNVPVAFTTKGQLTPNKDNAMVICHALTGSADVADWWGPLLRGSGRAFDTTRFFVVCLNSLGSPYGSASPVTYKDGDASQGRYGPEFPLTTIRDDVNIHKLVLDDLGVKQIAAVVGGSMGGMLVLEWAYFGKEYVRTIVPIATSSRHSAWGISWGEAQRQSIYSDPQYDDGYYELDSQPKSGLGAARMSALLTYRSRDSFESKFGRNAPDPGRRQNINDSVQASTSLNEHWAVHNEGHRTTRPSTPRNTSETQARSLSSGDRCNVQGILPSNDTPNSTTSSLSQPLDPQFHGTTRLSPISSMPPSSSSSSSSSQTPERKRAPTHFSAQSYLRYQGQKFVSRFDANCYIAITRKLDTHDVSRYRVPSGCPNPVHVALSQIEQPALVLGIESDGLFTFAEQQEIAAGIPNARLRKIDSPEGHDAFLLQFEQVNKHILEFFGQVLPDIMGPQGVVVHGEEATGMEGVETIAKSSTFGEAEVEDITAW